MRPITITDHWALSYIAHRYDMAIYEMQYISTSYWAILTNILDKQIYHCPYCNICRVGMGLGIDYFHCMNCNGCMGKSLVVHTCREKRMEDNCPVCKECIFASYTALKALPCGHVMHSSCFKVSPSSNIYHVWWIHVFFFLAKLASHSFLILFCC